MEVGGTGTQVAIDEDYYDDSESGISTGESTATTSVSSSIFSFTYANGRRYHSDRFESEYFMPNDEKEQDRLDLYHHLFLSLLGGKLYAAPLDKPQKVLDVGTGTGIWAIDFADEHPQAEVHGVDISPIQPSWVPPNCKFEVDDVQREWTYKKDYFDYVHMRCLSGSFERGMWKKVLKNAYEATTPGGWFEFQDYGCELFTPDGVRRDKPDPKRPIATWLYHIVQAAEKANLPLVIAREMKQMMEEVGFLDVEEKVAIWPVGAWPKDKRLKEVGRWGLVGMSDTLYPFAVQLLTKTAGWSKEQVVELCANARTEIPKSNYYFQGWFVFGRKPDPSKGKA